ncbi:SpoIIE family protein phosphatase [Modestobacter sp. I12A-02628]|uniref:Serine/threonine-protein phosphatase n=1 Tax=Goekera deserti TaxID=2497753 RepID=A0A7K3WI97_9ACTN|nr:SpoIIE family protein phosphatase [Goekera deserti]NDI46981.1 SpoIIE family protein phosphatase [Goekera deserti]NEL56218.1 serine/threonine-protein phosphatase [Goekera deserti]
MPLGVLAAVSVVDVLLGREQVVLGLLVMVPLLAALVLGRRPTAGYAALALLATLALGVYDRQYGEDAIGGQLVRLAGLAVAGAVAVGGATVRLAREQQLARASVQAATSRAALTLAEALQRSLLTDPPALDRVQTAVRYLPAARHAQVGGDWYDAFPHADGGSVLVIGDVAGHDAPAAAIMAQARGMLRGVAQTVPGSPSGVLTAVDRAFGTLQMTTLVTAVVAVLDTGPPAGGGPVRLRWSNAGHPPPVLVTAAGRAALLGSPPELLLGLDAAARRTDHELLLHPGDTLVLYTDGLVERRDVLLDEGTAWLVDRLQGSAALGLEALCDRVVQGMAGRGDDDVAVLAVRVHR